MNWLLGPSFGYAVDPAQMRALSRAELDQRIASLQNSLRPAAPSAIGLMLTNYQPLQQPLDERFADFKIRLAAAIERRRK